MIEMTCLPAGGVVVFELDVSLHVNMFAVEMDSNYIDRPTRRARVRWKLHEPDLSPPGTRSRSLLQSVRVETFWVASSFESVHFSNYLSHAYPALSRLDSPCPAS